VRLLCALEDEVVALRAELGRTGWTFERPVGSPKGSVVGVEVLAHPCVKALRDCDKRLTEVRRSLALTPSARRAVGLEVVGEEDGPDFVDSLQAKHRARRAGEDVPEIDAALEQHRRWDEERRGVSRSPSNGGSQRGVRRR